MLKRSLIIAVLLALPMMAWGQAQTTGRIDVKVLDENGAPVEGAVATIASTALQGVRNYTTDSSGRFLAALLPPGAYDISVTAPGAETQTASVRVGIGQTMPLEIALKPGGIVERVQVIGDTSKLSTTAGGENFSYTELINDLPIINRDPERVAELAPNVSFGPTPNTLSIAGAPSFDTIVLLDGAEVSDPYFGSAPILFTEEALEEVQVLTTGIDARYGRFQGGVINVTTKSGGNTLDGSVRVDLAKESWNQRTPLTNFQSGDLNKIYSATVSGPIIKDHLTYFVAGRTIPTAETSSQTALSLLPYPRTTDEDRFQVKLTGAVNPDHIIDLNFAKYDRSIVNAAGLPAADLRALALRDDPRETWSADYQGILSDRTSLNVQGTRKRVSIISGANDADLGSPFLDFYGGDFQIWHNSWWDFNDPSDRDNDTLSAGLTHVLSTSSWGDHTIEGGVQYVNSKTGGENRQSVTGFNLLNYDAFLSGNSFSDVDEVTFDPDNPLFNLIDLDDGGLTYRWEALPLAGGQEVENTALWVQDRWEKGRLRIDAGLRWETYEGRGPEPTLDLDFDALSPRLGVTYNMDNDWQLQATWGRYVSRFNDGVASSISGVGGAPYVVTLYDGPTQCALGTHCLTYDDVEALIQDDDNWGVVVTATDPTQPTRFLAPNVKAPYANDFNVSVKRALPRNSGTFTLTYTNRKYRDLLDDFVGDQGVSTVVDPGGSGDEFDFDTTIWDNASQARRDYEALTATWKWSPNTVWGVGGNWTYATNRGNYEGEGLNTPSSGSVIGNYVRSIPQEAAIPYGFTDEDIRHRIRAWGTYRFDFGRYGGLVLSSIGTYQSGAAYSLTGGVALAGDPDYLNEDGTTYTHFFGGRGNNRFNGFWRVDLGSNYQVQIWKGLHTFLKFSIINVTNNDEAVVFRTSGSADEVNGIPTFLPGTGFGAPRSAADFQTPRSYFVSAGLEW